MRKWPWSVCGRRGAGVLALVAGLPIAAELSAEPRPFVFPPQVETETSRFDVPGTAGFAWDTMMQDCGCPAGAKEPFGFPRQEAVAPGQGTLTVKKNVPARSQPDRFNFENCTREIARPSLVAYGSSTDTLLIGGSITASVEAEVRAGMLVSVLAKARMNVGLSATVELNKTFSDTTGWEFGGPFGVRPCERLEVLVIYTDYDVDATQDAGYVFRCRTWTAEGQDLYEERFCQNGAVSGTARTGRAITFSSRTVPLACGDWCDEDAKPGPIMLQAGTPREVDVRGLDRVDFKVPNASLEGASPPAGSTEPEVGP